MGWVVYVGWIWGCELYVMIVTALVIEQESEGSRDDTQIVVIVGRCWLN